MASSNKIGSNKIGSNKIGSNFSVNSSSNYSALSAPIAGTLQYNTINGSLLSYNGSTWVTVDGSSQMSMTDALVRLMTSISLYIPKLLCYDESVAIVINNYVDFIASKGFEDIDIVEITKEEEDEDEYDVEDGTLTYTSPIVNGYAISGITTTTSSSLKSYVDGTNGTGSVSGIMQVELCTKFIKFKETLSDEDKDKVDILFNEIQFVEKLSGE